MTRSHPSRRTAGALALIISMALAGCAATSPSPSLAPSASAGSSATSSASAGPSAPASASASSEPSGTASATATAAPTDSLPSFACVLSVSITATTDRAQITDVRVGTHAAYDRVTFEFASGIPQTTVTGVAGPFYADPSGLLLDVAGTAFLQVTMNGGTKVTPDGGVTYAGPTNFEPGFDQLVQLVQGGDSEALSTWYLGLDGGGCYRVLTLASPSRLVIDIEH
jgi:hypothetical protein